eukprot:NODE_190_length_15503_cov_0.365814.p5 type:complete len:234 gc:universal NODE_190_length_15503_cov_0.365814:10354-11055(+)
MGLNDEIIRDLSPKEIEHIKKRVSKSKNYPVEFSIEESQELNDMIQKISTKQFGAAKRLSTKGKKLKTRKALMEIIMFLEDELEDENQNQVYELEETLNEMKQRIKELEEKEANGKEKCEEGVNEAKEKLSQLEVENRGLRMYVEKLEAKNSELKMHYINSSSSIDRTGSASAQFLQINDIEGLDQRLTDIDLKNESVALAVEKIEKHLQNAFQNYVQSFSPELEMLDFKDEE